MSENTISGVYFMPLLRQYHYYKHFSCGTLRFSTIFTIGFAYRDPTSKILSRWEITVDVICRPKTSADRVDASQERPKNKNFRVNFESKISGLKKMRFCPCLTLDFWCIFRSSRAFWHRSCEAPTRPLYCFGRQMTSSCSNDLGFSPPAPHSVPLSIPQQELRQWCRNCVRNFSGPG